MRASQQDGTYPRPQLVRDRWTSLDGTWEFAYDDSDSGRAERWFEPGSAAFDRRIEVPYPPESPASGIGERGFHPVVWYRLTLPDAALAARSTTDRVLVQFGAVDHSCKVWVDGRLVVVHEGGQTPFTADVTDHLAGGAESVLVVRAEDDPQAMDQLRGKQDWQPQTHGIWYERTTGIWQPVWLEVVPARHVTELAWTPALSAGTVRAEVEVAGRPAEVVVEFRLSLGDEVLCELNSIARTQRLQVDLPIAALENGQDRARLAWTPEEPRLIDAEVTVRERSSGAVLDRVTSYFGLRDVGVGDRAFLLNGQPYETRSVLDQGYRPQTHLAARETAELRAEVELIKAMGFNAARVHQKAEDPRFLYWADRLGLLIWGETAAAYTFTPTAMTRLVQEWTALIRRDRSHPCIVAWVPINESWGVQDVATIPAQQQFSQAVVSLTRALDPSRPTMSNEGWEHLDSDILGVHDYAVDADVLGARYADRAAVNQAVLSGRGPAGRRVMISDTQAERFRAGRIPLMITEFGGVSLSQDAESWGYEQVASAEEYAAKLAGLFDALRACPDVVGWCYTQFMDTGQETNGLLYADGRPKLPVETIRAIVTGLDPSAERRSTSTFGWS